MNEPKEQVNHPAHYNSGGIECIDAMVAALGPLVTAHFCHGNAFKYLWRAGQKDGNPCYAGLQESQVVY